MSFTKLSTIRLQSALALYPWPAVATVFSSQSFSRQRKSSDLSVYISTVIGLSAARERPATAKAATAARKTRRVCMEVPQRRRDLHGRPINTTGRELLGQV